jgi:beta-fructofuranosidase
MHLFYLSSPHGPLDYPERVRTTWQHAVSDDLAEWRELEPAVAPGPEGSYDAGGIWTGSVVEKDGTFYLFYTAHDPGSANPQTICLATSQDLRTFEKHPGNPLVLPTAGYESVDWRDPYVFFNEEEGTWWMLIAARRDEGPRWTRGCIVLATSDDLVTWRVEEQPFYDPGDTFCPECPELWEHDGRWYLVYSRFSEKVSTMFRVADSPRGPFRIPVRDEFGGRRWYAAKSAPWQGARAFFGWVHDVVEQPRGSRRWQWGGDFTLPRIVTPVPTDDGPAFSVRCALAPSAGSLVGVLDDCAVGTVGGHGRVQVSASVPSRALVDLSFTTEDAAAVGFDVVQTSTEASVRLTVDLRQHRAALTLEPQPLDDFWADLTGRGSQYREVDGPVLASAALLPGRDPATPHRVRAVLDGDILEVYVDDDVALTHRVRRSAGEHVQAFVLDGVARVSARVAEIGDR